MPWITSGQISAKPLCKQTQLLQALAQRNEHNILLEWWQTANVPSDLGLSSASDEGAVPCVAELPLGPPSAAASPLIPAALRSTGKDSLKF